MWIRKRFRVQLIVLIRILILFDADADHNTDLNFDVVNSQKFS
jgi:hypothetical protein